MSAGSGPCRTRFVDEVRYPQHHLFALEALVTQDKKLFLVVALAVVSAALAGFVLTAVFGPSDNGLLCARSSGQAECQILQSRFFGLFGNTAFAIPETSIRGAKTVCSHQGVGRASFSCTVDLILKSGRYRDYPVLSYGFRGQADAATSKLNEFFGNPSAQSIDLSEDVLTPFLTFGIAPILLIALVMGLRWLRLRSLRDREVA